MSARERYTRLAIDLILALSITVSAFWLDRAGTEKAEEQRALSLARQIGLQAESMMLTARAQGERDPLRWAVGFLTQSNNEDRVLRVSRFQSESNEAIEHYGLNRDQGVFEFYRVLDTDEGQGIRIWISQPWIGFLGSRGRWASDFAIVMFFALTFGAIFLVPRLKKGSISPQFQAVVLSWVKEAKAILTQLGIHIREMIREAQNLAIAAAKSRDSLSELRDKIHLQIQEVRQNQNSFVEVTKTATQAEAIALNLLIEASRSSQGSGMAASAEQLHKLIQLIRKASQRNDVWVRNWQLQLEPWSTDADIAFHAYDDVFRATQGMDGHIRKTTETILSQAKVIQTLNQDLASQKVAEKEGPAHGAATHAKPRSKKASSSR